MPFRVFRLLRRVIRRRHTLTHASFNRPTQVELGIDKITIDYGPDKQRNISKYYVNNNLQTTRYYDGSYEKEEKSSGTKAFDYICNPCFPQCNTFTWRFVPHPISFITSNRYNTLIINIYNCDFYIFRKIIKTLQHPKPDTDIDYQLVMAVLQKSAENKRSNKQHNQRI